MLASSEISTSSYADKRRLVLQGLIEDQERSWKLTPAGRKAACLSAPVREGINAFARRHAHLRGDALIAYVYRRFPYFAVRSEMTPRLLGCDCEALRAIEQAQPAVGTPGLLTIGYEGRSLEAYLNCLFKGGVTLQCDVRRNPLSRKYGFSKATLSKSCEGVGIRYEHLPELGIPGEKRKSLVTQADYDALFAAYARYSLPRQQGALSKIQRASTVPPPLRGGSHRAQNGRRHDD